MIDLYLLTIKEFLGRKPEENLVIDAEQVLNEGIIHLPYKLLERKQERALITKEVPRCGLSYYRLTQRTPDFVHTYTPPGRLPQPVESYDHYLDRSE